MMLIFIHRISVSSQSYEDGKLVGFNVLVGGGMGMTHGDSETYPQLGHLIGFITPDQAT